MLSPIRKAFGMAALVVVFLAPAGFLKAQTVYSAFDDFSGTSNPTPDGVWSYGFTTTLGGPLALYTSTAVRYDPRLTQWTDGTRVDPNVIKNETGSDITIPLSGFFVIPATDYLYFHPGPGGEDSVIRWTAPSSGRFDVSAIFRAPVNTCPTTADVHVFHNGVSLFDALIEQSNGMSDQDPRAFASVLTIAAGDTIDFIVGFGSNGNNVCDRTLVQATISQRADFYLHGSGATGNPPTLFLDLTPPTAAAEKYKDSPVVNFNGGNAWAAVGTWTAGATLFAGDLLAPGSLRAWAGLKNSDDQNTNFDLRIEVYKNALLVASGETFCVTGLTRNPAKAREITVPMGPFSPINFDGATDVLGLKVFTRIGTDGSGHSCGGHSSAVGLRLYFDGVNRPSRLGASLGP